LTYLRRRAKLIFLFLLFFDGLRFMIFNTIITLKVVKILVITFLKIGIIFYNLYIVTDRYVMIPVFFNYIALLVIS